MSDGLQSQWAKLAGFIVGYQATWNPSNPPGETEAVQRRGRGL